MKEYKRPPSRASEYANIAGNEPPPESLIVTIPLHYKRKGLSKPCSSAGINVSAKVIDFDVASRMATVQVVCPVTDCNVILTPNVHY